MVDVTFFDPKQEAEVKRRRLMAQQMMQQGQQTPNEMVSGIVVKKSPLEGLAKALQTGYGGYQEGKADRIQAEDAQKKQELLARALGGYNQDPNAAAQMLLQSPATSELGVGLMTDNARSERDYQQQMQMFKERMPFELDLARQKAQIQSQYRAPTASPSSVQEYNFYNSLPDAEKAKFLNVKRATLGKGIAYDQSGNAVPIEGYNQALENQKYAENFGGSIGTTKGKAAGEAANLLADYQSSLPRLEQVVGELSGLGKTATYTIAGQTLDSAKRQAGLPVGEGAVTRTEYISKVDNEVLPLLRQTFGAAFTQKEGESLKATLGDANKSPEEKDAVLRSFIATKQAQIETAKRRVGGFTENMMNTPNSPDNIGSMGQGNNSAITQPVDQIAPVLQGGGEPLTPQEQAELDQLRARFNK